jgi:nucleoside-diphosphate-sugar epimerase
VAATGATGIFNLASGVEVPLRDVVLQIRDAINPQLQLGFGAVPYRPDQVMRMQVSTERLRVMADWRPLTVLSDGLAHMIQSCDSHLSVAH